MKEVFYSVEIKRQRRPMIDVCKKMRDHYLAEGAREMEIEKEYVGSF